MPKDLSAGYGEGTERKCRDFSGLQCLHLRLARVVMARNEWAEEVYHYIDLNAGPGVVNSMEGSPLLFLRNADADDGPWRAWFCERDPASAASLQAEVAPWREVGRGCVRVMEMDHRQAMPSIVQTITANGRGRQALGLAYADPNGLPTEEIESLRLLVLAAPKIDVLLHLSANTIKRCKSVFGYPSLVERLSLLGKKHLLIRQPCTDWQWTFALLTNWVDYPDWRSKGFYAAESPTGAAILETLNLSAAEQQKRQLKLW